MLLGGINLSEILVLLSAYDYLAVLFYSVIVQSSNDKEYRSLLDKLQIFVYKKGDPIGGNFKRFSHSFLRGNNVPVHFSVSGFS